MSGILSVGAATVQAGHGKILVAVAAAHFDATEDSKCLSWNTTTILLPLVLILQLLLLPLAPAHAVSRAWCKPYTMSSYYRVYAFFSNLIDPCSFSCLGAREVVGSIPAVDPGSTRDNRAQWCNQDRLEVHRHIGVSGFQCFRCNQPTAEIWNHQSRNCADYYWDWHIDIGHII